MKWNAGVVRYNFRHRQDMTQQARTDGHNNKDDLDVPDHQGFPLNRKSMSQVSEDGMGGYGGMRESTADGNHSDDEDNRMNHKFANAAQQ